MQRLQVTVDIPMACIGAVPRDSLFFVIPRPRARGRGWWGWGGGRRGDRRTAKNNRGTESLATDSKVPARHFNGRVYVVGPSWDVCDCTAAELGRSINRTLNTGSIVQSIISNGAKGSGIKDLRWNRPVIMPRV